MHKLILAAASVAALALIGPASAQAPIIIKLSHVVAPNTPKGLASEKFKELAVYFSASSLNFSAACPFGVLVVTTWLNLMTIG